MADKMDPAHAETEAILKNLESRIKKEYQIATKEMEDKISDYMSRFTLKDQKWQEWVSDGTKTADQYKQWRQQQMMVGKSYESLKDTLADEMVNADKVAKTMIRNTMPSVYAENFNFGVYETEMAAKVDTSFTLYNKDAIARLLQDDPDFIPPMGKQTKKAVSEGKVKAWNKQQVQSVITQGILQGESIPKLSKRLATTVGERNYKSAIRNARTMTTGVENAGRMDAYKRQEALGIDLQVEWRSVLDNRTRHEHRQLDGQRRPVGEPFEVHGIKIEYGGDPHAPANMIYNCRCTINAVYEGLEPRARKYREIEGGQTYEEWKNGKAKSNPIDLQEQKGKAIEKELKKQYRTGKRFNDTDEDTFKLININRSSNKLSSNTEKDLQKTFSYIDDSVLKLNEELMSKNAKQLITLNKKFDAINTETDNYITTHLGTKERASTYLFFEKENVLVSLSKQHYEDINFFRDRMKKNFENGFHMPCSEEYYDIYTITHEFGHILTGKIARSRTDLKKLNSVISKMDNDEVRIYCDNILYKHANDFKDEIIGIAKDLNPDFSLANSMSEYASKSSMEFFAEVFANSQCGKPNDLGNAMIKWLEREGF